MHFWRFSTFVYRRGEFKSGTSFFFHIVPFLYTCFSSRAVLVVFDSLKAGAFDRVTGRQRDGTGRGGRKYILGSRLA